MKTYIVLFVLIFGTLSGSAQINYLNESEPEMGQRMQWFTDAKYGMFIHFGLYSQLGGIYKGNDEGRYAEWIQANQQIPKAEYVKLLTTWNPKNFDADKIVKLAKKAGMKYLVITTKHHEGFCLWDSEFTEYDIANTPMSGRDFIKELSEACKKQGIHFGTYYSIIDWNHPSHDIPLIGTENSKRKQWQNPALHPGKKAEYVLYMKNQIKELIEKYDTEILWFDGDWADYWTLEDGNDLYQYIRELKPGIIINNRVSKRKIFKKDFGTPEQFSPDSKLKHYWEACYTMNDSWGFKGKDTDWKSPEVVYQKLKEINALGGNLLLNVGPDGNGEVPIESAKILKEVGSNISSKPATRNTFMVFGNTYVTTPEKAQTSILASINKAVEDADIDFVIIVGELTISAAVDQFKAIKYVMDNSPVPVYVTASNHDLVYTNGDWKSGTSDDYARFSEMLNTETEYTISKGRSCFIMQSHIDSIGTNFTNNELEKLESNTFYDFVYHVIEVPLIGAINLDGKPVIGISGGNPTEVKRSVIDGRHVRVSPTENKINDNEDDYLIFKENEGYVLVDSYVDRSLNKSFKIIINRSAGTCSVEGL